jgi:hypothetical protein
LLAAYVDAIGDGLGGITLGQFGGTRRNRGAGGGAGKIDAKGGGMGLDLLAG